MSVDRWTVRECNHGHGLFMDTQKCPFCFTALSEPFEVVRAMGARTTDPSTSKLAALRQQPRSGSQRGRILDALGRFGPMTAREIERMTGIGGAWKRVSELKQGGHIREYGEKLDRETGNKVTIYAIQEGTRPSRDQAEGAELCG